MEKIDRETAENLREGDAVSHYIETEGWRTVRKMIDERLRVLDSVSTMPTDLSWEEIGKQTMMRAYVIDFVTALLEEIEGRAEQHRQQAEMSGIIVEEEIIRTYSSPT